MRILELRGIVRLAALAVTIAAFLLAGCDMPSLGDLDLPEGDSTLAILPSTVNVEVGADATLTAKGGKAPYVFEASEGNITVVNATTVTFRPPAEDTYIVTVTDAAGAVCEATVMATASVPLSVSPSSITVAAGTTVTLVASGGSGGYWFEKIDGEGTLESAGPDSATYRAVDEESAQIRLHSGTSGVDALLTFTAPPTLAIIPGSVALYVNTVFTFAATGGTGGYTYTCTGNGSVEPLTGVFTAGPTGDSAAYVTVEDDGGRTAMAAVAVDDLPGVIQLSPSNIHVGVGGTVTFTVSEGDAPFTYALTGAGSISPSGPTAEPTTTYTAPLVEGNGITITVTDTDGDKDTATIYVDPPPTLQINPATVTLTTNEGVTFTATGGTGGYQYAVVNGTGVINPSTGLFTAPAVAEIDTVRVTDSGGRTADATVEIYFPLTIVPTDAFVPTNGTYTFSASGGKTPYTFGIVSGIGGWMDGAIPELYHAPGTSGEETVRVLDALGNASYATVTVFAPTWDVESVDTALKSGQYASLALDPFSGHPGVAYYDSVNKELRYVSWNGTSWSSEVVDTSASVGQYCSLALDPDTGYPRISYYDSSNRDLKYAAWNGSSWTVQAVESAGMVGTYTSLALDPKTNRPRISYYDFTNRRLKYAEWSGTAWELSVVDQVSGREVGKYSSLALDAKTGDPRIAYASYNPLTYSYDGLKYAAWDGKNWVIEIPDAAAGSGQHCSLALDADGNPRISYCVTYNFGAIQQAWYASRNGSGWSIPQKVDPSTNNRGTYSSLELDPSTGNPRIACYDATDKKLVYASYNGSDWNIQGAMDPATGVGTYASLCLDGDGKAVIAYYNSTAQDLKIAKEP